MSAPAGKKIKTKQNPHPSTAVRYSDKDFSDFFPVFEGVFNINISFWDLGVGNDKDFF